MAVVKQETELDDASEEKRKLIKQTRQTRTFGEEEKNVALQKAFTGVNQISPLVDPEYIQNKETNLRGDAALQQFLQELIYIKNAGISHPYVIDTIETMILTLSQILPDENLRQQLANKPLETFL